MIGEAETPPPTLLQSLFLIGWRSQAWTGPGPSGSSSGPPVKHQTDLRTPKAGPLMTLRSSVRKQDRRASTFSGVMAAAAWGGLRRLRDLSPYETSALRSKQTTKWRRTNSGLHKQHRFPLCSARLLLFWYSDKDSVGLKSHRGAGKDASHALFSASGALGFPGEHEAGSDLPWRGPELSRGNVWCSRSGSSWREKWW